VTKKTQKYKPNKRTRKHKKRKNTKRSVIKNTNTKRKSSKKKNRKLKKQCGGDGEKFSIEVYEFLLAGYPSIDFLKKADGNAILDGISVGNIKAREANEANEANKINYYKVSDKKEQTDNKVYSPDVVFNSEQAGGWTKGLFKQYYETSNAKILYLKESVLFEGDHKNTLITLLKQLLEKTTALQDSIYENTGKNIKHERGFIYKTLVGIDEKVITFGDFHGSYHTFFRHMIRLETLGILKFESSESSELSEPIDTIEKLIEKLVDKLNLEDLPKIIIAENYRLLFLGDILDRGKHALEIVIFILILIWSNNKVGAEPKIIYNRGNHEEYEQFVDEGFFREVTTKLIDNSLLSTFKDFFTSCPSAVILQHREGENKTNIWCCHGGIPYLQKQKSINKLKSFLKKFKILNLTKDTAEQVRWNDLNVKETKLGPRSGGAGPDWAIDQNTLKTILSTLNIDFLIRGHQDSYANTVLFVEKNNNTMIKQFLNGLDIQDIINPNATEKKASTLSSELEEFKSKSVNPIGSIQYKTDNTKLSYNFAKPEKTNAIEPNTNDYQKKIEDLKAITISTNTDYGRPLTRDSFVVIKFNQ